MGRCGRASHEKGRHVAGVPYLLERYPSGETGWIPWYVRPYASNDIEKH